jgi:hypothetical protein
MLDFIGMPCDFQWRRLRLLLMATASDIRLHYYSADYTALKKSGSIVKVDKVMA